MAKVLCFCFGIFLAFSPQATLKKAVRTGEIVRLHVVAAGDSAEEQRVKLCVRDAVLDAFGARMKAAKTKEEALNAISGNLSEIERTAKAAAEAEDYFGPVRAIMGVYAFPDREYEGVLVPRGDYQALRIVLGEGEGQNWWCLLYPSLCLAASSAEPAEETRWCFFDIFKAWF